MILTDGYAEANAACQSRTDTISLRMKSSTVELKRQPAVQSVAHISHVLGSARIGFNRELKHVLEKHWKNATDETERLVYQARETVCHQNWKLQKQLGLSYLTAGDFAFYDHVLSTLSLVGGLPNRFNQQNTNDLNSYFEAARGSSSSKAMAMRKWFNTNYHYMVPEFNPDTPFEANTKWLTEEIDLVLLFDHPVKVNVLGPVSLLWLGREHGGLVNRLELLPRLLEVYKEMLAELKNSKVNLVQLEEPVACLNVSDSWREAFALAYTYLPKYAPAMLFTTYFIAPQVTSAFVFRLPVTGVHIDITNSFELTALTSCQCRTVLSVGVVDGRNIWKNDVPSSVHCISKIQETLRDEAAVWVSTSCSLLHCPYDLSAEKRIHATAKNTMAFGVQKIREVARISQALECAALRTIGVRVADRFDPRVGFRVEMLADKSNATDLCCTTKPRSQQIELPLPIFPTTTVGSFPQTPTVRLLRSKFRNNAASCQRYVSGIKKEIEFIVAKQLGYGLDVLAHGEAERNDMVEYFGELLAGFVITTCGWVQSFGSRCAKPPIIFRDVSFVSPMSVYWFRHAQRLTDKPVKGMVTGPTTMLNWSFVRADLPYQELSLQLCHALQVELSQLTRAGAKIIQIDEPAIRERLPLTNSNRNQYLNWVAKAFNVLSADLTATAQIHTHVCYAELEDIMAAITKLDVDAISIEAARSDMRPLQAFLAYNYNRGMGFGLYDIHSPIAPNTLDIIAKAKLVVTSVPNELVWVNPDCGLKTRTWDQVDEALINLVEAAKQLRIDYQTAQPIVGV